MQQNHATELCNRIVQHNHATHSLNRAMLRRQVNEPETHHEACLWISASLPGSAGSNTAGCRHAGQPHNQSTVPSSCVRQLALPSDVSVVSGAETEDSAA